MLPSLIRVNALSVGMRSLDTQFFSQAMRDDLDAFLLALSSTQDAKSAWRNSQAIGSACDCPGIAHRPFDEIREMLRSVRQQSASYSIAQQCRRDLEDTNATLLFTYFPPHTFQGRAGDFMVQWYSSVLHGLEEKPLWPPSPNQTIYRFVWIRSFHDPVSITMQVEPEGNGQLRMQILDGVPRQLESKAGSLSKDQVQKARALIEEAHFWAMTTEGTGPQGTDGAEWVLEGVDRGQYHIVTRWDASGTAFGRALLEFLQLSGYNPPRTRFIDRLNSVRAIRQPTSKTDESKEKRAGFDPGECCLRVGLSQFSCGAGWALEGYAPAAYCYIYLIDYNSRCRGSVPQRQNQ